MLTRFLRCRVTIFSFLWKWVAKSSSHLTEWKDYALPPGGGCVSTYVIWNSKSYFDRVFTLRILPSVDLYFVCVKKGNTMYKGLSASSFLLSLSRVKSGCLWASLVAQWLRIYLSMQETRVQALVREDPTCRGATKPVRCNYWACPLEPASHNYWARMPPLLKPMYLEPASYNYSACVPQLLSRRATTTEACVPRARALQQEKPPQWEAWHCNEDTKQPKKKKECVSNAILTLLNLLSEAPNHIDIRRIMVEVSGGRFAHSLECIQMKWSSILNTEYNKLINFKPKLGYDRLHIVAHFYVSISIASPHTHT